MSNLPLAFSYDFHISLPLLAAGFSSSAKLLRESFAQRPFEIKNNQFELDSVGVKQNYTTYF